ncbi:retrovirus-related Pol polyprotein from transposon 297 [Trichonephila clavipes]|nr:retrovirus-related Pol polyprotein from transposon 297 [Trichonephila clavipes]
MPFRLCNAVATFERMMDNLLHHLKWTMCLCYLDDIIVFSETFNDHLQRLRRVLKCIQDAGLVLNFKKCVFGSRQINIFWNLVSEEGIMPNPGKVRAVQNFPAPKNICDIRSFLGLCSYYRQFIKNFCLKARPLQELLKSDSNFTWGSNQKESFERLKTALMSKPVLGLFDEKAPTELHADASSYGLAAVLVQIHKGKEKGIAYASRTLTKAERNYSMTDRECLAFASQKHTIEFGSTSFGQDCIGVYVTTSCIAESVKGGNLPQKPPGLLIPITPASVPFQCVGIDLLGRFPKSTKGNKWIIVCADYLSHFTVTKVLPTAEAVEVAIFITEEIVLKHGAPRTIVTDCGKVFESKLVSELDQLCSSKHRKTTGYHPQTNGLTKLWRICFQSGVTYNVGMDKRDTTLDSPGEIVLYLGPMMRSGT